VSAVERWGAALREWAIPEEILRAAPESPWTYPVQVFRGRAEAAAADRAASGPPSPSVRRALEALPEGGSVLDVGSGSGAASLALVPPAGFVTAVDPMKDMLASFAELAAAAGVGFATVLGAWPDAGAEVGAADVVVCAHVLYNVQDLRPFVAALTERARARVVVEVTREHPRAWMNDLWRRFWDLDRPDHPTADDLEEALGDLELEPGREDWVLPRLGHETREESIATARRRLCLTADRDDEVAEALGQRLWEAGGKWGIGSPEQRAVTLWWNAG
jgi:SAM-dependent methyltransferase